MEININRAEFVKKIFLTLILSAVGILLVDIFLNYFQWIPYRPMRRMLNIAREDSIGTWFMTTLMLFIAMTLFSIFKVKKSENEKLYWGWLVLAVFFFYLGIDDAIKFHERVGSSFKLFLGGMDSVKGEENLRSFFPSYTWQVVFMPFFGGMGVFILWFLRARLGAYNLFKFIIAALTCYSLAVGLDFVEGFDNPPYHGIADFFGARFQTIKHMSKAIEEFLEILGTIFFFRAYLGYLVELREKWIFKLT